MSIIPRSVSPSPDRPRTVSNSFAGLLPHVERTWPISYIFDDQSVIGRNEKASLCIRDIQVSRVHAIIERTHGGNFVICDKSAHGTFVNGKQLVKDERVPLHNNDIIRFSPVELYTYIFRINKKLFLNPVQNENLNSLIKEKRSKLNDSQSEEMQKLNEEIEKIQIEKSSLQDEMEKKLSVQENIFQEERMSLSRLISDTNEQKDEAEKKLRKMEENINEENIKLRIDVENKIEEINRKEVELQQLKDEMEQRHQREREELEERCKAEVAELKEKLAESEKEQSRLQGENRVVEKELEETKMILQNCELEQQRIFEEKIIVETKLESKIIDLTKERSTADEQVKELQKKLRETEEQHKKDIAALEENLQCSICVELFVDPTVLNCGHIFCKQCIEEWKKKKKICPMCRTKISNSMRIFHLDSIISSNVGLLSEQAQKRRENMIDKRLNGTCPLPAKKRKHTLPPSTPPPVTSPGQSSAHSSTQSLAHNSAQGSAQGSAHSSGQGSAHSSGQGLAHSSAQGSAHSSGQGLAHGSAQGLVHNSAQSSSDPFFMFHRDQTGLEDYRDPLERLRLTYVTSPSNLEDPFSWARHGRNLRPRHATAFDQVLDLTHVIGPPVSVAAIDLTHLDPTWPQPSSSTTYPASAPSPNTTIDLTSP